MSTTIVKYARVQPRGHGTSRIEARVPSVVIGCASRLSVERLACGRTVSGTISRSIPALGGAVVR